MDALVDWVIKNIPPSMLDDTLGYLGLVALVSVETFSAVQAVKVLMRYFTSICKPSHGFLDILAMLCAPIFALLSGPGDTISDRAGAAVVAWLVVFVVAKWGLTFIKWRWPTLWQAINLERRKPRRADPTDTDKGHGLRDGDQ